MKMFLKNIFRQRRLPVSRITSCSNHNNMRFSSTKVKLDLDECDCSVGSCNQSHHKNNQAILKLKSINQTNQQEQQSQHEAKYHRQQFTNTNNNMSIINKTKLSTNLIDDFIQITNADNKMTDINNNKQWTKPIGISKFAINTTNPVRKLLEQMKLEPNPNKQMIALSIGDPTILSDLQKPECVENAIKNAIKQKANDGYTPSFGTEKSRDAIAKYSSRLPHLVYKSQDVILTHGCSHALELAICVLANAGQNILIPRPGFSIYKTLSNTFGIEVKYYNLLPENDWMIDLEQLASQIDENTVGIVVNNPSNPCGSVYSKEHLKDILTVAEYYHLPIIADEVYGDMVFAGKESYYLSELSTTVPILSCNALSKRFILPGWRFGWITIHDPKNLCQYIRQGLMDLSTRILGPNSLVQAAVVEILEKTPKSYYDNIMATVQRNADIAYEALSKLPGVVLTRPSGAMYMMMGVDFKRFPNIKDDTDFVQRLVQEQSVFCIPATSFSWPNYIRIVLTMKADKIVEACERIGEFIHKHYTPPEAPSTAEKQ